MSNFSPGRATSAERRYVLQATVEFTPVKDLLSYEKIDDRWVLTVRPGSKLDKAFGAYVAATSEVA